eukprot:426717-Prymnesium_polylepis.1
MRTSALPRGTCTVIDQLAFGPGSAAIEPDGVDGSGCGRAAAAAAPPAPPDAPFVLGPWKEDSPFAQEVRHELSSNTPPSSLVAGRGGSAPRTSLEEPAGELAPPVGDLRPPADEKHSVRELLRSRRTLPSPVDGGAQRSPL